jgi:drug/metabolite transporter (DMT)-like permease
VKSCAACWAASSAAGAGVDPVSGNAASHRLLSPAMVLVAATGFAFKAILIKLLYAEFPIDPETILALRLLFSLPFFILMAVLAGGARAIEKRDWQALAALGFLGYFLSSYFDFLGLQYITAGLERLILYLQPTMVVLLSAFFFRTRVRRHHVISLALSYGGIALVYASNLNLAQDPRSITLGSGLVFMSALSFAFYLIGSGTVVPRIGSTRFTAFASMFACSFATMLFFAGHGVAGFVQPPKVYWTVLLMALVSTVLPVWLMAESVRRIGANQVSMIGAIGPIVTIYFGWLLLDEPVTTVQIAGVALVLAGVLLVSLKVETIVSKRA